MADHDALSPFYNESKDFTSAIERCLATMATSNLSRECITPTVWSLCEKEVWFRAYEIAARCLEVGAASIKLSHEIIALLSSPDKINSAMACSQGQPLAVAIGSITIAATELQKAAETARDVISALKTTQWGLALELTVRFTQYLTTALERLPLGQWTERLGEFLSSVNRQERVTTGVMFNNIIAVFQGHVVRVSLHELSLTEKFSPSSTANINSPLMGNFYQEVLPDTADYVGLLANYVENNNWDFNNLMKMFNNNIISSLEHLEIYLSGLPDEMMRPLSELLTQYAAVFTSLLGALSSALDVQQYMNKLTASDTHLLALNPSTTLSPLLDYQEAALQALTSAQSKVNIAISRLKQDFVITDWPTTPENVPEHLECIKNVIIDLLSLSEGDLSRQILVAQQWVRDISEPIPGVTFLSVTRSLFSKFPKTQGESHLTLLNRLFPYCQVGMDGFVGLNAQLPRDLQPLSPNHLVFGPQDIPQSFWTQLSLLAKKRHGHTKRAHVRVSSHWRSYPCKKQIEFVAQSRQGKSSSQASSQGNPVEMINLPKSPLDSSKTINPKSNGGSFQGDWSF